MHSRARAGLARATLALATAMTFTAGCTSPFRNVELMPSVELRPSKPVVLSRTELEAYIKTKKIVLFGELHDSPKYAEAFADLIPKFKELGITHIGLELDWCWQSIIDKYMANPTKENGITLVRLLDTNLKAFSHAMVTFHIINRANRNGLRVIGLDTCRDGDYGMPSEGYDQAIRDQRMTTNIDGVLKTGGRVATLLGRGHIVGKQEIDILGTKAKPVGRRLLDEYGEGKVGLVDLTSCDNPHIFACFPVGSQKRDVND